MADWIKALLHKALIYLQCMFETTEGFSSFLQIQAFCSNFKSKLLIFAHFRKQET